MSKSKRRSRLNYSRVELTPQGVELPEVARKITCTYPQVQQFSVQLIQRGRGSQSAQVKATMS